MNELEKIAATLQLAADDLSDDTLATTAIRALLIVTAAKLQAVTHYNFIPHKHPTGKFVALYNDGSGAGLFEYKDGELFDGNGDECDPDCLDDYLYWAPVPQHYTYWGEDE